VDVDVVNLRRCALRVSNLSGWTARLDAIDASFDQSGSGDALALNGWVRAAHAAVGDLVLNDVSGGVRLAGGQLALGSLRAGVYGGALDAAAVLGLDPPQEIRLTSLRISGAQVAPALKTLHYGTRFGGSADVELSGEGRLTPMLQALRGEGKLSLHNFAARADLPHVNLFNVAPILTTLKQVDALSGSARLSLAGPRVELTDIVLERPDLRVTGAGWVSLAGALEVGCTGFLREGLSREVPGVVRGSLGRSPEGDLMVPFRIQNTLAEPKVDVDGVMKGTLLHPIKKLF
jgi:hypothetical protein